MKFILLVSFDYNTSITRIPAIVIDAGQV